jgi:hypothetical protein
MLASFALIYEFVEALIRSLVLKGVHITSWREVQASHAPMRARILSEIILLSILSLGSCCGLKDVKQFMMIAFLRLIHHAWRCLQSVALPLMRGFGLLTFAARLASNGASSVRLHRSQLLHDLL